MFVILYLQLNGDTRLQPFGRGLSTDDGGFLRFWLFVGGVCLLAVCSILGTDSLVSKKIDGTEAVEVVSFGLTNIYGKCGQT